MQRIQFILTDQGGLHARPAGLLVQKAASFKSNVTIEKDGKSANAKSILQIIGLGAKQGSELILTIEGEDEQQCAEALSELLGNRT